MRLMGRMDRGARQSCSKDNSITGLPPSKAWPAPDSSVRDPGRDLSTLQEVRIVFYGYCIFLLAMLLGEV